MAHEFHKGIMTESSWHGLEDVGVIRDAEHMIDQATKLGAYPLAIALRDIYATKAKIPVPGNAVIARYHREPGDNESPLVGLGVVGNAYRPTEREEWNNLIREIVAAGGKPCGAFSLRGGSRVLAVFEIGNPNGIKTYVMLADSFDGSINLTFGVTSIRVVCANTLSMAMRSDGRTMTKIRHSASAEQRIAALQASIAQGIESGETIKKRYADAMQVRVSREDVQNILETMFPAAELDDGRAKTLAQNKQTEVIRSMARAENAEGPTLASVWNGLTWTVDRTPEGKRKKTKGKSDQLDSLLFGTRGRQIAKVDRFVADVIAAGSVRAHLDAQRMIAQAIN